MCYLCYVTTSNTVIQVYINHINLGFNCNNIKNFKLVLKYILITIAKTDWDIRLFNALKYNDQLNYFSNYDLVNNICINSEYFKFFTIFPI